MPRANYFYTTKAFHSVYPIEQGRVVILDKPRRRPNSKAKLTLDHQVYIWILRLGHNPSGRPPKERKVQIMVALVPLAEAFKHHILAFRSDVQFEYIVKMMSGGYRLLTDEEGNAKKLTWNYNPECFRRFWKAIGVLNEQTLKPKAVDGHLKGSRQELPTP